ncbi:MAG TPA: urease accessory UreF family protein [Burkholderiaceae bacterium]
MSDAPVAGDAVLLQLMWLASPALPVGGFSYSEGLEAAVDDGRVTGEASAADWLASQMALAPARADLPVLAQAHLAWRRGDLARVTALNDFAARTRETRELRLQTEQMGRSLVEWLRNQDAGDDARLAHLAALAPSPTWPVAFALATARANATAAQALHASLFGWAENMVQASLKAVPLGQLAGQRILQALVARMPPLIEQALAMADDDMQSFSPMLGIASARHETQYSRLFRS